MYVRTYDCTPRYDTTMVYTERAHRYWAFWIFVFSDAEGVMTAADWLGWGGGRREEGCSIGACDR